MTEEFLANSMNLCLRFEFFGFSLHWLQNCLRCFRFNRFETVGQMSSSIQKLPVKKNLIQNFVSGSLTHRGESTKNMLLNLAAVPRSSLDGSLPAVPPTLPVVLKSQQGHNPSTKRNCGISCRVLEWVACGRWSKKCLSLQQANKQNQCKKKRIKIEAINKLTKIQSTRL